MTTTEAITKVERACAQLLAEHQPVAFTQVAIRSGMARTTLYRNPALRAVIEEHRNHDAGARTLTGLTADIAALHTALEAIAARVRRHEQQLRRINQRRPT
jgi:hypothetical protein